MLLKDVIRLLDLFYLNLHGDGEGLDVSNGLQDHFEIDQSPDTSVQIQSQLLQVESTLLYHNLIRK